MRATDGFMPDSGTRRLGRLAGAAYDEHLDAVAEDAYYVDLGRFLDDKSRDFIGVFLRDKNVAWFLDSASAANFLKNFGYSVDKIDLTSGGAGDFVMSCSGPDRSHPSMRILATPWNIPFDLSIYSKGMPATALDTEGYRAYHIEQRDGQRVRSLSMQSVFYPMNHLGGNKLPAALMSISKEIEESNRRAGSLGIYR